MRFIYVRPKEYYLRLDKTRDVIEWQLDETLDINGWDIQKMLRLLHSSNPTVFEWKNSPIVYKSSDEWKIISKIIDNYFDVKSGIYHYLSMAKRTYHNYFNNDTVKLKKYFYVLRPLLACDYIRENQKSPPMLFENMLCYLDGEVKNEVLKLLEMKKNTSELGEGKAVEIINSYVENKILELEEYAKNLAPSCPNTWQKINTLFVNILK